MILFSDATILTEAPPLHAAWAPRGQQAVVPITGRRNRRVRWGVLNPATGDLLLMSSLRWEQEAFQQLLVQMRSHWRGWHIVLFIDRGSPHTAQASGELAASLGIQIRWLPVACPELNPVARHRDASSSH